MLSDRYDELQDRIDDLQDELDEMDDYFDHCRYSYNIAYYKIADNFYDGITAADCDTGEITVALLVKYEGVQSVWTSITLY